jgi:hypothetical protein
MVVKKVSTPKESKLQLCVARRKYHQTPHSSIFGWHERSGHWTVDSDHCYLPLFASLFLRCALTPGTTPPDSCVFGPIGLRASRRMRHGTFFPSEGLTM